MLYDTPGNCVIVLHTAIDMIIIIVAVTWTPFLGFAINYKTNFSQIFFKSC